MALSAARTVFGIHSIAPFNRSTGEFYGIAKVLKGSNFSLSGEVIELTGGSSKFPWQVEDGLITAELSLTMSEYPSWAFELFLGQALTQNSAETSGNVTGGTNVNGTSIINATNGIGVSATVGSESYLKFGKYVIKAVSANTFDVYAASDVDFSGQSYVNDLLKITSSPLSVASADAVISAFGLTFDLNGTAAFTIGDTAEFDVRPVNTGSFTGSFGSASATYPEFGAVIMAQAQGSGRMIELTVYKLKAIGAPINFAANEFSEFEITCKASYDSTKDAVFAMREVL